MNDEVLEVGPKPELEQTSGDIVLLCHPRNVTNLVQALEIEFAHADGALPLSILWSGTSCVLHQGVIVLTWEKTMPTAFLQNLARDHEIFDYVPYVYDWVPREDHQEDDQARTAQSQDGKHQTEEKQRATEN